MFISILKSETASAKAKRLSSLEARVFDMHMWAAVLRPDSHLEVVDYTRIVRDGKVYEIYLLEIDIAILSIVFSQNGRMALLDFHLTADLLCGHTNQFAEGMQSA